MPYACVIYECIYDKLVRHRDLQQTIIDCTFLVYRQFQDIGGSFDDVLIHVLEYYLYHSNM